MPYKDKGLQRGAGKKAAAKRRGLQKGITEGRVLHQGITKKVGGVMVDAKKAAKLLLICKKLDKEVAGLERRENMLDLVRFGVHGPTVREVRARLT